MSKKIKGAEKQNTQKITSIPVSADGEKILFDFSSVDTDGAFSFDPHRDDFDAEAIFAALLAISKQTWAEIKQATHNNGKSRSHVLSEDSLTREAFKRINALGLQEESDDIFSLRINAKIRIIGIRMQQRFVVKWYDPKHQFSQSSR